MGELTPPLAAEKEALREAYAALNRNDILGFVKVFDAQIERIDPAESHANPKVRVVAMAVRSVVLSLR